MERTILTLGPGGERHPDRLVLPAGVRCGRAKLPTGDTLSAIFRQHADNRCDEAACYFVKPDNVVERMSWGDLYREAARMARGLSDRSVAAGDRVIIALPTSSALLSCFVACQFLGALPCIVEPPKRGNALTRWTAKLAPKLAVLDPSAIVTEDNAVAPIGDGLTTHRLPVHAVGTLASDASMAFHAGRAADPAFLQFTSGTTSLPKAVACSHQAIRANIEALASLGRWHEGDLILSWLPLFHDLGLVATTLAALAHGLPIALMQPISFLLSPARWLWAMHALRATLTVAPNFAYQLCVKRFKPEDFEGLDLSSMRMAYNGAEFVHAQTIRDFVTHFTPYGFNKHAMAPAYGMAEMVVGVSTHEPEQPVQIDCISRDQLGRTGRAVPVPSESPDAMEVVHVGTIFAGHDICIRGPNGEVLAQRQQGEICVRGPSMFAGYYRNAEATRAVVDGGWLRTGDLGYLAGGRLFVSGRAKELIIRGGENYHPHLIERAAAGVEGVRESCVAAVGMANKESGTEDLVVLYETLETSAERLDEINRAIGVSVRAATGLTIERIIPVTPRSIPKTTSGKIQRGMVRDALSANPDLSRTQTARISIASRAADKSRARGGYIAWSAAST